MSAELNEVEFVFGGTFDPIHNGHLAIVKALNEQASNLMIRLIPCAIPALKSEPQSSVQNRLEMIRLAIGDTHNIILDEREINRQGKSYTLDTLVSLSQDYPDRKFILVMGADSVIDLKRWFQWQKLKSHCHLLVINRPGTELISVKTAISETKFKLSESFDEFNFSASGSAFLLNMAEKQESSSQIRQILRNNLELDSMLPQSVIKYILNHQLYQR